MTLTEFLLARIAEDEREVGRVRNPFTAPQVPYLGEIYADNDCGCVGLEVRRVLAECEAKRRIVERLTVPDPHEADENCADCFVLYALALPYAVHPDYREEWKP